jgi:DNA processing protein
MEFNENICLCALNRVFGNFPVTGRKLLETYESATALFSAPQEELRERLGNKEELAGQIGLKVLEDSARELEKLERGGQRFIAFNDPDYPSMLLECPDCPLGLYVRSGGSMASVFEMKPCIAIVGTRNLTPYGRDICTSIVKSLSECHVQPVIVSGLAYGADCVAHTAALSFGIGTIGVMATGMDRIYPYSHQELAFRIAGDPLGALVSDYPCGTSPVALNFLRRNRIIAGLCKATIVIESKRKGGSLVTAKYAVDYNRDLFAVPGRVGDNCSSGCNSLISTRMAEIVTSPEALGEKLGLGRPKSRNKTGFREEMQKKYGEGSHESELAMLVYANRGIDYSGLVSQTGWSWSEVASVAAILESDGVITTDMLQRCSIRMF